MECIKIAENISTYLLVEKMWARMICSLSNFSD